MRKLLVSLLACALALIGVSAQAVTLAWDPNSEENLDGYVVYSRAETEEVYTSREVVYITDLDDPQAPSWSMATPTEVTIYALTAFDTDGLESDFSDEVSFDPTLYADEIEEGEEVVVTINPPQGLRLE